MTLTVFSINFYYPGLFQHEAQKYGFDSANVTLGSVCVGVKSSPSIFGFVCYHACPVSSNRKSVASGFYLWHCSTNLDHSNKATAQHSLKRDNGNVITNMMHKQALIGIHLKKKKKPSSDKQYCEQDKSSGPLLLLQAQFMLHDRM